MVALVASNIAKDAAELLASEYTLKTGSVPLGLIITQDPSCKRNLNPSTSSTDTTLKLPNEL
jgi:hypothetical protein